TNAWQKATDPSGNELFVLGEDAKDQLLKVLGDYDIPFTEARELPGGYGGRTADDRVEDVVGISKMYQVLPTNARYSEDIVKKIRNKGGEKTDAILRLYKALTIPGESELAYATKNGKRNLIHIDPHSDLKPNQRAKVFDYNLAILGAKEAAAEGRI